MAPPSTPQHDAGLAKALARAIQLHQSQRDTESETACRQILQRHPDQAEALHLAGLLAHGRGQSAEALALIRRAIECAPDDPDFQNSLGNVLFEQSQLAEAAAAYRQATRLRPDYAAAYGNLGLVLQGQGDWAGALAAFQEAIAREPAAAAGHNNLGVLRKHQGDLAGARAAFQQAVDLAPDAIGPLLNLADVLDVQDDMPAAIATYQRVIALAPELAEAYYRLGHIACCQGRFAEAAALLEQAVQRQPNHADAYFDLGKLLDQAGDYPQAIAAYRRCLAANPRLWEAYFHLGNKLVFLGRRQEAAAVWAAWLEHEPENSTARHMFAAATGQAPPSRAGDDYVRTTFDGFADCFDSRLERLDYRAPQVVADCLGHILGPPTGALLVLDAGCGTGLCAPWLRPYARRLTGVDLSAGMIAKAQQRGGYDTLTVAELTAFLAAAEAAYDLIAASDTLNYFGDLRPVLQAASRALRPAGHLVFTLEESARPTETPGFVLELHGRYAHTERYVTDCLHEAGLASPTISRAVLRTEMDQPVVGLVVSTTKNSGPGESVPAAASRLTQGI